MSFDANENRETVVIRMRDYGFNFAQIGAAFGVSAARARQIHVRAERLKALQEQAKKDPSSVHTLGLSTRALNGLLKMGVEKVPQAKGLDIAEMKARGIGRKSLREITDALKKKGVVLFESCRHCGTPLVPEESKAKRR